MKICTLTWMAHSDLNRMTLRSCSFIILVSKHVDRFHSVYLEWFSMSVIKVLHCVCYLRDISNELTHAHSSRIYYYYYYYYCHHHHPCYHLYTGFYNSIPETNHVSRVYSVAAVLYLRFVLHVMLFRRWNYAVPVFGLMAALSAH
jgi:branched-subunit amino acid transport protein AzlD